jgi:hypothetical protein
VFVGGALEIFCTEQKGCSHHSLLVSGGDISVDECHHCLVIAHGMITCNQATRCRFISGKTVTIKKPLEIDRRDDDLANRITENDLNPLGFVRWSDTPKAKKGSPNGKNDAALKSKKAGT